MIGDKILLISSAANIRRKEIQSNRCPNQTTTKRKGKKGVLDLQETKDLIKETMEKDWRGVKSRNKNKHIHSIEKWHDTGMWEEILKEGEEASERLTDSIRLLYIPHEPTLNDTDPPPPPGYLRKTFDARGGTKLFKMLLACSTQLHGMVKEEGRNLASMSTEITLLADEKLNKKLARENNILVTTIGQKTLLQTYAIIDSGQIQIVLIRH